MDLKLSVSFVTDQDSISEDDFPVEKEKVVFNAAVDEKLNDSLLNVVEKMNIYNEDVLYQLFDPFFKDDYFEVKIRGLYGVPAPYDAWFIEESGLIYFNLSCWDITDLKNNGEMVIKHEITHYLFHKLFPQPLKEEEVFLNKDNMIKALKYHMFDEGLATFISLKDKEIIFSKYIEQKSISDKKLSGFQELLLDEAIGEESKKNKFEEAFTGSFWDKFAVISGMFRVGEIYKKSGVKGLQDKLVQYQEI